VTEAITCNIKTRVRGSAPLSAAAIAIRVARRFASHADHVNIVVTASTSRSSAATTCRSRCRSRSTSAARRAPGRRQRQRVGAPRPAGRQRQLVSRFPPVAGPVGALRLVVLSWITPLTAETSRFRRAPGPARGRHRRRPAGRVPRSVVSLALSFHQIVAAFAGPSDSVAAPGPPLTSPARRYHRTPPWSPPPLLLVPADCSRSYSLSGLCLCALLRPVPPLSFSPAFPYILLCISGFLCSSFLSPFLCSLLPFIR